MKKKIIFKQIIPDKKEQARFKSVTTDFLNQINSKLKGAKAILGGSGAKNTWLAGNHDVDIYVIYNFQKYAQKSAELADLLEKVLKKTFPKQKISRLHGSRDYFQLIYQKLHFEIIPILKISRSAQALNITDISPLHAKWVNQNCRKLKDEVRLAKKFFRANNLYGAESYISGFSGYGLEILIAYYGSFTGLLQASQRWKIKEVVDPENYYKNKDVLFHLNRSKTVSPLIIIDPVDKKRNVAAALSEEKFIKFKQTAKNYLKKPDFKFFEKEKVDFTELKKETEKNKHNLVFIEIAALQGKEDVVGVRLLKAFLFLEKELNPFSIIKCGWEWDKAKKAEFYFVLGKKELPKFEVRRGPPLKLKDFVNDFKKKNKGSYEKGNYVFAKVKVKHPQLRNRLKILLKEKYFVEKVKKVEKVRMF